MAPAARKRVTKSSRKPLASTTTATPDQTSVLPNLVEIFNSSQHVTSSDVALTQLKKLYKNTEYNHFVGPFRELVKKLFQSKQTNFFKTSCEFLCKFLQHVSKLSDELKAKERETMENLAPASKKTKTLRSSVASECSSHVVGRRGRQASKRGTKRKADVSDDELVADFMSSTANSSQNDSTDEDSIIMETTIKRRKSLTKLQENDSTITNHDRLISSVIDVADLYMQVADGECRLNAVLFICKFVAYVESLDEEICNALKMTLPKRIRDRKPMIRAQAVLASRKFQDNKMIQDGFLHHFYRDPELVVRKALLQIMETNTFGYDFLVDSTQDTHESMRKAAFQRLGKITPQELSSKQLHNVIHNGLIERERQASYAFKTYTLEPWLSKLYDGLDLYKLLEPFDVINNHEDVCRLLNLVYERDLDKLENGGTTTKLHHVVETFREHWLNSDSRLPVVTQVDEKVTVIWLTLVQFCQKNHSVIKPIKIRTIQLENNISLEKILDSQENRDEVAELYERLKPDLVNLVDYVKKFVQYSDLAIKNNESQASKLEYIYIETMRFIASYEIGDELERKTVQEIFGLILKENLLIGHFKDFIPPVIQCLFNLIYSSSSNLMINYISELINNVRSHLEDLVTTTSQPQFTMAHSTIVAPGKTPKSSKKVKIDDRPKRSSYAPELDNQNLEYKIATIRVEIQDLRDKLDACIKDRDYDQAKIIDGNINDLQAELQLLHGRRCSMASDVSHMSMIIDNEPTNNKLSSTMIGDASIDESQASMTDKEDLKIFKHHTNELVKCLQMYFGCLQNVKISEVPQTMLNHLTHLSYECLDDWFKNNVKVRSLMVACNGVTALVDKQFARQPSTVTLFIAACYDPSSIEIRTVGFKSLVDMMCRHEDLEIPLDKLEKFLNTSLRDYGKYNPNEMPKNEFEFAATIIEGTAKLFYHRKIDSPEILSHIILWWYHPRTHSKLKQFIGIFLPTFVNDIARRASQGDSWLSDLLEETFVTSIEYLHDYILGPGFNIMAASDMHSLINFLSNLVPISFHVRVSDRVDKRIDDLSSSSPDLMKYLKQSKNSLTLTSTVIINENDPSSCHPNL